RADFFWQTESYAMTPAFRCRRFRRDQAQLVMRCNAQAAARRHYRNPLLAVVEFHGLFWISSEFSNGAECADAPCGFVIRKTVGDKIQHINHHIVPWLHGDGAGGVVFAEGMAFGSPPLDGDPPAVSLMPPDTPRPGRRKPPGSSYCWFEQILSMRANSVTSSLRA